MNTRILLILALNWLLVGCVSEAAPPENAASLAGCQKQSSWICTGTPQAPTVNLNTESGKLKATPGCIKAKKGAELMFRLTPTGKNALNSVEIIPKDAAHTWLAGTNSDSNYPDLIVIDVPIELDEDVKYYYGFKAGAGCVDPRVRVEN